MYYNSSKQTNDYYNSYKREMQELKDYEKQGKVQQLMKIIFLVVVLCLLSLASYYLYKYFNPDIEMPHKVEKITLKQKSHLSPIVINEEKISKSEKKINISQEEIALIVKIIMAQINNQKELSLEEQIIAVESTTFTPKKLKDSNHYNKVIINNNQIETNNSIQNSKLVELSQSMNHILEEPVQDKVTTNYSTSIKKEIAYRENEMRVIVVKKGDTLSRIAKRAYGDYNDYTKILSANPEIIKNPDQIYEGMRLRIPS